MRYWCKTDSIHYKEKMLNRFWQKVNKTRNCWNWTGARLSKTSYGQFKVRNINNLAHRVSYEIHFKIIPRNMDVLHSCDNPICVNPKHLFIGDHKTNMMDKTKKGRTPSKLSQEDIPEIRKRIRNKESLCSIGKLYGVGHHAISDIRDKVTWNHVITK